MLLSLNLHHQLQVVDVLDQIHRNHLAHVPMLTIRNSRHERVEKFYRIVPHAQQTKKEWQHSNYYRGWREKLLLRIVAILWLLFIIILAPTAYNNVFSAWHYNFVWTWTGNLKTQKPVPYPVVAIVWRSSAMFIVAWGLVEVVPTITSPSSVALKTTTPATTLLGSDPTTSWTWTSSSRTSIITATFGKKTKDKKNSQHH